MTKEFIKNEIQKLKQQVNELRSRKKLAVDEIDQKINRAEGRILYYQNLLNKREV